MRFVCISHPLNNAGMDDFAPYIQDEVRTAWQNVKDGITREIYFRQDILGVVIMAEAESQTALSDRLAQFPLAEAGLIAFDIIPIGPFTNWELLFAA